MMVHQVGVVSVTLVFLGSLLAYLHLEQLLSQEFKLWTDTLASPDFSRLATHCAKTSPIDLSSYTSRQRALARILTQLNASAYIAEPGANAQFFLGLGKNDWHLSERPLLVAVRAAASPAEVLILAPAFEQSRAMKLPIQVPEENVVFTKWTEDANPYEVLLRALSLSRDTHNSDAQADLSAGPEEISTVTIYVDSMIRKFIADGLQAAAPKDINLQVLSAPKEITSLRERKSTEELEIMRCANEVGVIHVVRSA